MKYGVADYGMGVWDGGNFDTQQRLVDLKGIGFEGIERLSAVSVDDAMYKTAMFRQLGMGFTTVRGGDAETSLRWAAALGVDYVWVGVPASDLDVFCRQANKQIDVSARWGIDCALHNHLGTPVESQPELETFLQQCPKAKLVLDTAHLAAADGDPVEIVRKYPDRLSVIHLKDWMVTNPEIGLDSWPRRGRFCELGAGNIGLDNLAVMEALKDVGYDGWIFIEHDTHLQDPLKDLAISLKYLRDGGF